MENQNSRDEVWSLLGKTSWDILVIGGGITGAGILREATRLGLKVALIEQCDFAWGTSSRSSKLVHGGLRYLQQGKLGLTRASVHEREQLLTDAPGLIDPMGFLLTIYKGDFPGRWTFSMGLTVYDLLALRWDHEYYSPEDFQMLAPHIAQHNLQGGFRFGDAQTDDARLVLRVIREAVQDGGTALNYARAEQLLWKEETEGKRVAGALVRDVETGRTMEIYARVVVNATGAWADRLRSEANASACIRPLRGSHLIFPSWRLPVAQAVSFLHPIDHRPVFIFPWEGITLVGTTDIDHSSGMEEEPSISPEEVSYLMAAVEAQFPSLQIGLQDIIATYSGVRPVIGTGKVNPSEESREHVIWQESGLLTVTGGKLTTFRLIAQDTLKSLRAQFPELPSFDENMPLLNRVDLDLFEGFIGEECEQKKRLLCDDFRRRLLGRYGSDAPALVAAAKPGELEPIPGTVVLWAELRWSARAEDVVHLEDLLLRRVRLGLLLPQGGASILPRIRDICQAELGWDDARWEAEQAAYLKLWSKSYSLPEAEIPDWRAVLAENRAKELAPRPARRKLVRRSALAGGLLVMALGFLFWVRRLYSKTARISA